MARIRKLVTANGAYAVVLQGSSQWFHFTAYHADGSVMRRHGMGSAQTEAGAMAKARNALASVYHPGNSSTGKWTTEEES